MNEELKTLSLKELQTAYRSYLSTCDLSPLTIQTSGSDAFVIWRRLGSEKFWRIIESSNFEQEAFDAMNQVLPRQADGQTNRNIHGYLSHLRRFRRFVYSESATMEPRNSQKQRKRRIPEHQLPTPTPDEVQKYLNKWNNLENYRLQENALDKLFFTLCPQNICIEDILLKSATLNDFYSTNIYSTFPVARHILQLNIDERLSKGDPSLVDDIKLVAGRNHYSFATKYCSHHNPIEYPIYDSYVEKVLKYFRDVDGFEEFELPELKQYGRFKDIILKFRAYYGLTQFTLKEIDKYIWQLGKKYFNRYKIDDVTDSEE